MKKIVIANLAVAAVAAFGEAPYSFRRDLAEVHRPDRRDWSLVAAPDEFAFTNGVRIAIAPDAPEMVREAAEDFRDYLLVSMGVNASVRPDGASLTVKIDPALKDGFTAETTSAGVSIAAGDAGLAAQALYHLEDRMNLREAPFMRMGKETRRLLFPWRLTFTGWGNCMAPDDHLRQLAHYGFTGLLVWLDGYDVISQGPREDVNDLIRRAKRFGLGVKLSPRNFAFVHPDDPRSDAMYEEAYGKLAAYYPEAAAFAFCGEVAEFPSKDPRANGRSYRDKSPKTPGDTRPNPGWYPCYDWKDWVEKVKGIMRRHNPNAKFVFSTYNWGWVDEGPRADLIASLPKDVTLIPTFEMFEKHVKRNGLESPVADYSISFIGPGKYFRTEAEQAHKAGIELWSNCNAGGLTWDYGNVPFQPAPYQWKKRWAALREAHERWGLSGLRENHEFAWFPSFIAELEKEQTWSGGMGVDEHLALIARRDFGAANVADALATFRKWSDAAADYVPTDANQYGPFRVGPAYPFNYFGEPIKNSEWPVTPGCKFCICNFNYNSSIALGLASDMDKPLDEKAIALEVELLRDAAKAYFDGAETFARIAASLPEGPKRVNATHLSALGEYMARTCQTAINVKLGLVAWTKKDRAETERLARLEYANAKAALGPVAKWSRLGWLTPSDYTGGREQIEWKLARMRKLYGIKD